MSEAGHIKNVTNFEILVTFVTNLGTAYKPSRDELKQSELNTLLTAAQNALADVNNKLSNSTDAVNQRETAFSSLSKLTTRVGNAFAVCDVDQTTIDDVKAVIRKIQGKRAASQPDENPTDDGAPKPRSSGQMGYDDRVENFDQLVSQLENQNKYTPNETELQITALNDVLINLRAKNSLVINTNANLSNARLARNNILYDENKGLVKIAGDVKKYIKSVFGATSPQSKQISGLKFINQVN